MNHPSATVIIDTRVVSVTVVSPTTVTVRLGSFIAHDVVGLDAQTYTVTGDHRLTTDTPAVHPRIKSDYRCWDVYRLITFAESFLFFRRSAHASTHKTTSA